jgi:hypothetical protein
MSKNYKAITNGSSDDEMQVEERGPLQTTIRDLLGPNFNVGNYALVSMLTMVAVMFMFQTDIIAFQEALSGLNPDQITALTIALGGPININGITDPEQYRQAVTAMYQNFAATVNLQQENVAGMVEEIVRRNTEMQELIPAGWTFPSIYGEERFDSVVQLGNRILGDATNPVVAPVSQLFSTVITSLRTQIGIPSMTDVVDAINDNISDFVQTNPRLEPARAYYRAVLGIFNGGGNLWEDLQNISTITASNQYYHIYGGVFVAFYVAVRNTVSITGYVAQGIVRAANGTVSFIIGEELYNDIVRQVGDTTRNVARLPVEGVYYTARFVIHRVNDVVNLVARALTPGSQFDLFMGDPQDIPDNLIVGGGNYALPNADSSVDYDTFTEIANFLELYILDNEHFQRVIEMLNDPNLAQHIGFALEQVLVPEQNMGQSQSDSQESEMTMDTRGSSYASSVSGTYGSNPALMASFLRNILSVFFTASAIEVIEDPNVDNPAVPLIQNLTSDLDEGASQSTQDGLERIETVIIPNVERITEQVEEVIEHPPVFGEGNMNVVSAESSQNSEFSVNEAANVLMDMPDADSSRLGGRKRKSRAKKQKGGKRKKTMKKSKLRKHKTLKRRKSNKKRKTRKM